MGQAREFPRTLLGARVLERRLALGLAQWEVADRAGIRQGMISNLEVGRTTQPWAKTLSRLAKALETTTDYLLGMDDSTGEKNGEDDLVHD